VKIAELPPIPTPAFQPWAPEVVDGWKARTSATVDLGRRAGMGRNYEALVAEVRALLLGGQWQIVDVRLSERRFARALISAWSEDEPLARKTMTVEAVTRVRTGAQLSRLATIQAATLYAEHFDRLDDWAPGLFAAVRDLVWHAVQCQPTRQRADVVEALRANAPYFADKGAPSALARDLVAADADLYAWFKRHHIGWWLDLRLGRIARDHFYLAQIAAADAEQREHAFLEVVTQEVMARQQTEDTDEHGLYFGHYVLGALTAKTTRRPSEAWLTATMSFAGDPRMRNTAQWQTWWAPIADESRQRSVRWLQGLDLRAFLKGVENYADRTGNDDMKRMLERRARLLLGLYEQDRIEDVRLVLGDEIRRYIESSTTIPVHEVARLSDSVKRGTAVIYVNCGDFSLVEGSHSFQLHTYVGDDGVPEIADRRRRSFTLDDLRDLYPARHQRRHGIDSHEAVRHQGFAWVVTTLDFLYAHGIRLDERALLSQYDYAELCRRRGWY
jgi:hypothetical protein